MTAIRASVGTGPAWVATATIVGLIALAWFLRIDASAGLQPLASHLPRTVSPQTLDGAWLSNLVVWILGTLPWQLAPMQTVLSACVIGVLLAWLYYRLIYNDWSVFEALCFVGFLAGNSIIIAAVNADHRAIPIMLACAAIVPGIRRLESVGDVQAEMRFGLVLPLLFLAGPMTALLIPMLAAFGALSDRQARSDGRAFTAMLLVAIMPTVLLLVAILGMLGHAKALDVFQTVYLATFKPHGQSTDAIGQLLVVAAYTILPFTIVTVAYFFNPDRRRQRWSAMAVMALPLYLVVGAMVFAWQITPTTPTIVFLGTLASWLSVTRLTPTFRWVVIGFMLVSTVVSWSPPMWTDGHSVAEIPSEPQSATLHAALGTLGKRTIAE